MRVQLLAVGALAVAAAPAASQAQVLYGDNFDNNTAQNYTVNADPDTTVTFNYNYSVDGIPSAPNSIGGTTTGVKFTANNGDATAAAAAINISPTGQSFTGDYTLTFDMWINANGPFPGGGTGSTEYVTAGVGTTGLTVQKSSPPADGAWFAVDGEGGSVADFRAYREESLQTAASGAYAAGTSTSPDARDSAHTYYHTTFPGGQQPPAEQQAAFPNQQTGALREGAVGFAWREVEITKTGSDVSWTIDGLPIATLTNATLDGDNIFVGYWDVFASISDNAQLSFGIVDNLVVVPEPASLALVGLGGLALLGRRRRA